MWLRKSKEDDREEAGMVTAETALTVPAVITVVLLLIVAVSVMSLRAQTCSVAAQAGWAVAIGENYPLHGSYVVKTESLPGGYLQATASLPHKFSQWLPVQCELVVRLERE
ncbi:MAG: hypothetical protein Q4D73_00060 [Actinomycetaceae bacterium]|nr:hypothetical protein [Actinomycetaceae bacterium]